MSGATRPLPESAILRPRDPTITNSNDWPEFRLSNATITTPASTSASNKSKPELCSLLTASEVTPLSITGTLNPPSSKSQAKAWLTKPSRTVPTPLELQDVFSFSYGAYEDGSVELWAAGKAGWFIIRPSKAYKETYDLMIEAVKILFFIVDAYRIPRKRSKAKNATPLLEYAAQEVFEKYAIEILGVEKGAPEAAKKIYKHRDFLLASMIEGKEGMSWGKNPVYAHLCRKFPEDAKRIRVKTAEAAQLAREREIAVQVGEQLRVEAMRHARQASADSTATNGSLKRKRGRPPKDSVLVVSSSMIDMSAAHDPGTTESSGTARSKGVRATRSHPGPLTPDAHEATTEHGSDSERSFSRRKSALRLKPNKATKGVPMKGRRPVLANISDDEDELASPHPEQSLGSKRKRDDPDRQPFKSTTEPAHQQRLDPHRPRRKPRTTDHLDEGIDIPTSPSPSASASDTDAAPGASPTSSQPTTTADLALRNGHKPSHLSPGKIWLCALSNCTHRIYSTGNDTADKISNPETQRLIREHYALHAFDEDDRVNFIRGMAEPSLPVNYLVERVRGVVRREGGRVGVGIEGVGSRFPEPLRTRF